MHQGRRPSTEQRGTSPRLTAQHMRDVLHDPEQLTKKLDEIITHARTDETKEFWRAVKQFAVNTES